MKTTDFINYLADEGKVFVRKADGLVMGWGIGLGSADSIENYEEADCPEEHKGDIGYDNTMLDDNEDSNEEGNEDSNVIEIPVSRIVS